MRKVKQSWQATPPFPALDANISEVASHEQSSHFLGIVVQQWGVLDNENKNHLGMYAAVFVSRDLR